MSTIGIVLGMFVIAPKSWAINECHKHQFYLDPWEVVKPFHESQGQVERLTD